MLRHDVKSGVAKVVLITGCSAGIGRLTAKLFAARGWSVVAAARRPEEISLDNVTALRLDVTDDASIASAVAATVDRFGTIDVLVNNAGYGLFWTARRCGRSRIRSANPDQPVGTSLRHLSRFARDARASYWSDRECLVDGGTGGNAIHVQLQCLEVCPRRAFRIASVRVVSSWYPRETGRTCSLQDRFRRALAQVNIARGL